MNRNLLNFIVDGISALVMLGLVATGLIGRFVLPAGSGNRLAVWGMGRHDWGDAHFWLAAAGAALLLVHVALHWQWVCTTAARMLHPWSKTWIPARIARNLAGAGILAVLVGSGFAFVWVARARVVETTALEGRGGPWRAQDDAQGRSSDDFGRGNQGIRGSLTLSQAADALGVSVEDLRQHLRLPADVDPNARLGSLRQQHGFTMSQIRAVAPATRE